MVRLCRGGIALTLSCPRHLKDGAAHVSAGCRRFGGDSPAVGMDPVRRDDNPWQARVASRGPAPIRYTLKADAWPMRASPSIAVQPQSLPGAVVSLCLVIPRSSECPPLSGLPSC